MDLSQLPVPEVIDTLDFETVVAALKADFVARYPDAADLIDLESEPAVKLIESFAYRELLLRARYNDEARALLLAYASGADLDHIGASYYDEDRLVITTANPDAIPPVEEVLESDDDYRDRLQLKPEGYSTAGPTGAYEYYARSASGHVKDAKADSPTPGTSRVYVLSRTDDGSADQALLDTVSAALNDEDIRPQSEEVLVESAVVVNYALDIGLILFAGATSELAIAAANTALTMYAVNKHRLKTDIILSAIDAAASVEGVKKVIINSPAADIDCGTGDAPWCTGVNVTVAGVEE